MSSQLLGRLRKEDCLYPGVESQTGQPRKIERKKEKEKQGKKKSKTKSHNTQIGGNLRY